MHVVQLMATFFVCLHAALATPQAPTAPAPPSHPAGGNNDSFEQPNFSFKKLWDLHKNLLDNIMFPNCVQQAKSINSTIFAENVIGRVDVTREFLGRELNTEYFFGLFTSIAESGAINLVGVPQSYETVHFAASQNVVASSTIQMFNYTTFDIVVPIEVDFFLTFNALGQVSQYDITFRWFDFLQATLIERAMEVFNISSVTELISSVSVQLATSICDTHDKYCTGPLQQYASHSACMDFLTHGIRFGAPYELGRNTLQCRDLHQFMLPLRPSVHCPHIGPTGGGMCVDDLTYVQKVLEPLYTNCPMVPHGFQSDNATIAAI